MTSVLPWPILPWPVFAAWIAVPILFLISRWRWAAWLNVAASLAVQGLMLRSAIVTGQAAHWAGALIALCAVCASICNFSWLEDALATSRINHRAVRRHHALFQGALGGLLGMLARENAGLSWAGLTMALFGWGMAAALPGTRTGRQAFRRIMMLGGGACLLGQLGLVLSTLPQGELGRWFLLFAALTLAGIGPQRAWLTAALSNTPEPMSIMLAGSLPAIALLQAARQVFDAANPGRLGLVAILLAGLQLIFTRIQSCPDRSSSPTITQASAITQAGVLVLAGMLLWSGESSLLLALVPLGGALILAHRVRPALKQCVLFAAVGLPPFGLAGGLLLHTAPGGRLAEWGAGGSLCWLVFGAGAISSAAALVGRGSATEYGNPVHLSLGWTLLLASTIAGWSGWLVGWHG